MARSKKINGMSEWAVESILQRVESGETTIEQVEATNPQAAEAIRKLKNKRSKEAQQGQQLTGHVSRETDKAVLFRLQDGREDWLPKSQVQLDNDHDTGLVYATIPGWLAKSKFKEEA